MKDFKHVLGYLASLDQIHSLVNLFKYQQAIERDLVSMYEKELYVIMSQPL